MDRSPWLPFGLLVGFGAAFAWTALGDGLLIFDDHPGQLFRLWHGLRRGLLPWEWNPDWWAGYPELQFYPPGFVLLGAFINIVTLKSLSVEAVYRLLLWIAYLAPGITSFWLMVRVGRNCWVALVTGLTVMTMSAGSRSGVEGGLRIGMVAARLGLGLIPLLALSLYSWQERGGKPSAWTAPLLAGLLLTHPAHAPAGVLLVLLAMLFGPPAESRRRRWAQAVWVLALAAGLGGVWTIPLGAHLEHALPLAWGDFAFASLGRELLGRPLLAIAGLGSLLGLVLARTQSWRSRSVLTLVALPPALLGAVAVNALGVERWEVRWLPSDRLLDSLYLALVLSAGVAIGRLVAGLGRREQWAVCVVLPLLLFLPAGPGEPDVSLWPRSGQWPKAEETIRILEMDRLWEEIRRAPPGRILFLRSGVPLVPGREWHRPHTHLTALTPLFTRKEIVNGTFTHPSPIAGLLYSGSAAPEPIRQLVETLDGRRLFGQPIEQLSADAFESFALRLGISGVVALQEDLGRLRFVEANPAFDPPRMAGPFALFFRTEPRSTPEPVGARRWRLRLADSPGGWMPAGLAFYPLWRAEGPSGPLRSRRGPWGLMEVEAPPGRHLRIDLVYGEGPWEWLGLLVSGVAAALWLGTTWRRAKPPPSLTGGRARSRRGPSRGHR